MKAFIYSFSAKEKKIGHKKRRKKKVQKVEHVKKKASKGRGN